MNEHDIRFMERALELARKVVGLASPNPTVGCVIVGNGVHGGQIVGEGFHQYDWRDHAEMVALKTAGERARGATAYVTLEPCNTTGRTGPCAQALVKAGITRVVAATQDPNPQVAGRGFDVLRAADVIVDTGVCEGEARRLNHGFACWIRNGRPFVTLKSAMTLDGQLTLPNQGKANEREWITSDASRVAVQNLRPAADALLTGIGTILADDPLLTDRSSLPRRRRLLRVILDARLRLSPKARIVKSADNDLVVFTGASLKSPKAKKLQDAGVEVANARSKHGLLDLKSILKELGQREILNVLLEAGPRLNGSTLTAELVDRLFLFYAPKLARHTQVPFSVGTDISRVTLREKTPPEFWPDFAVYSLLYTYFDL